MSSAGSFDIERGLQSNTAEDAAGSAAVDEPSSSPEPGGRLSPIVIRFITDRRPTTSSSEVDLGSLRMLDATTSNEAEPASLSRVGTPTPSVAEQRPPLAILTSPSTVKTGNEEHRATFSSGSISSTAVGTTESAAGGTVSGGRLVESPIAMTIRNPYDLDTHVTDLDARAAALLDEVKGLVCVLPTQNDAYDRPAGPRQPRNVDPVDGVDRRNPGRALSGVFRSHDDIDSSQGLMKKGLLQGERWTAYTTPDGLPYFVHLGWNFITDVYIRDPQLFAITQAWARKLNDIIEAQRSTTDPKFAWPAKWELYLRAESTESCEYYIIDYDKEQIFWLHEFESFDHIIGCEQDATASRRELQFSYQFYTHMSNFPHQPISANAETELQLVLTYASIDTMVSPGSTSPYTSAECRAYLDTLDRLNGYSPFSDVKTILIARLLSTIYRNRLFNRFGEDGARLDRAQPSAVVSGQLTANQRFWYSIFHVLVFGSDAAHMAKITRLTVDNYVPPYQWQALIKSFVHDTEQSNILAALFFTGNIGFLALGNLDIFENTFSLISTAFSLASLLIGLHHVRQRTSFSESHAYVAAQYLQHARDSWLGYRALALHFCLPWALLIWSIMWFLVPIFLYAFMTICTTWWSIFLVAYNGALLLCVLLLTIHFFWKIEDSNEDELCHLIKVVARSAKLVVGVGRASFGLPERFRALFQASPSQKPDQ